MLEDMTTIPRGDFDSIQFFKVHASQWADHAAEVGLSQAEADRALELAKAAAEAHAQVMAVRQQALAATEALERAIAAMRSTGGKAIAKIRAHAAMSDDPGVITLALLEPASTRRAPLPPAQPRIISAELQPLGAIKLRWRVHHTLETRAEGTQYMVMRMIPGVAGEERWRMLPGGLVAGRGRKSREFTDHTLPPAAVLGRGGGEVRYTIVPRRAGVEGAASLPHTVRFGAVGGLAFGAAANPARAA